MTVTILQDSFSSSLALYCLHLAFEQERLLIWMYKRTYEATLSSNNRYVAFFYVQSWFWRTRVAFPGVRGTYPGNLQVLNV